jgi:hypothetical protein
MRRVFPGVLFLSLSMVTMRAVAPAPTRAGHDGLDTEAAGMEKIELTDGRIAVVVLPSLGGRVVSLGLVRGENLLDSDPKFWRPPFPKPALETPFTPWNGRIVWVGPQSGFWSQQDLRPDLKSAKAVWPPDPFNEAGRFEVLEKTPTRLRLKGAVSPVTGLALEHEYEITSERTVRMRVTATNGRLTPVSWDLWPNTRVRPDGFVYVLLGLEPPRVDGGREEKIGAYPYEVEGGWASFRAGVRPMPPQEKLWTKLYLRPERGLIAYFHRRHLLLIRAAVVPRERLHPEQAFIELYRGAALDPAEDVLELEMHGAYQTLQPGASMSFEQTFEVLEGVEGDVTPADHLARLTRLDRH